jgi:anaerobic ribonucleoside-triphosphate reductase activating protein
VQGCSLRCPGCCNPHFFDPALGEVVAVEVVLERLRQVRAQVEGITLLGGEPFEQAPALAALAVGAREWGLSVVTFSGYTLQELRSPGAPPGAGALLAATDLLIDGRYDARRPERARRWAGSTNQRFHDLTARYSPECEPAGPGRALRTVEVRLSAEGRVEVNGWPERWPG